MSTSPLVIRRNEGRAVILTLNRPEKRNALSRQLVAALSDELDKIAVDHSCRVVVLTGAGSVFCAGMDLAEATRADGTTEAERSSVQDLQGIAQLINQIHQFPRPMIAALQGDALGGGAGIALACDYVLMSETARLGFPEVLRGLVGAVVLHDLVRQVGDRRARQLLLSGDLIDSRSALSWGLINQIFFVDHLMDGAISLAEHQCKAAPLALATTKRLLDESTQRPVDLLGAAAVSAAVRAGDEAAEGMRAFLEKRPPNWA